MQTLSDMGGAYLECERAAPSLHASGMVQTDLYDPGRGPEIVSQRAFCQNRPRSKMETSRMVGVRRKTRKRDGWRVDIEIEILGIHIQRRIARNFSKSYRTVILWYGKLGLTRAGGGTSAMWHSLACDTVLFNSGVSLIGRRSMLSAMPISSNQTLKKDEFYAFLEAAGSGIITYHLSSGRNEYDVDGVCDRTRDQDVAIGVERIYGHQPAHV
ncbi:hypothetical protein EDD15DRAFT_2411189 [Pisolithus albus]|nr:hypothetical protein EDD15DRAFT_2411189 [Pisolithus albus]